MRIVFLAWQGSIHTRRWVSWFADRGHEVHVITCGGGPTRGAASVRSESGSGARYTVHDLGSPRPARIGYFRMLPGVRRLLRQIDPDVVHAHFATSYGMLASTTWNGPLAVTAHGDDVLIAPRRQPMRAIVQRALRKADLVTVPAPHMADAVDALVSGIGDRLHVFQYGVDLERLTSTALHAQLVRSSDEDNGRIRIVSNRAHLPLYRIDALIDACAVLQHQGRDIHLSVAGTGPQRPQLEAQAAAMLDPDSYRFEGHMQAADLEALVASNDLYVSVAESDGTSLSLLEAMALGAVPVVSNIPANTEWIDDGVNGVIAPVDPVGLADAMIRALSIRRATAVDINRARIAERGDFATNMARMEALMDELGGVRFDDPGTTRSSRGKAA